jgi:hypothetical protein
MGLDMYLSAKKYVSGYDHSPADQKEGYRACVKALGLPDGWRCDDSPSAYIDLKVGYWRKANQIHAWFVKNVQSGADDCGDYYVSRDQLKTLLETCQMVLEDRNKAPDLLPAQSGFFFGSTEYSDYYFQNLKATVNILTKVLKRPEFERCNFYYRSSW